MVRSLSEEDWDSILKRIHQGNCTPFLGAGASANHIGVATEIAQQWARQYAYPLPDLTDLMRVAQFRAVKQDADYPKEDIASLCKNAKQPGFRDVYEVHRVLADLLLKTYITTNYDTFYMIIPAADLVTRFLSGLFESLEHKENTVSLFLSAILSTIQTDGILSSFTFTDMPMSRGLWY